jgi:hypothetical protein
VELLAVDLDDELLASRVDLGSLDAVVVAELEEPVLELAAGWIVV